MATFVTPVRQIMNPMLMDRWLKSPAYQDFVGFITALSSSVNGKSNTNLSHENQAITLLQENLNSLLSLCHDVPPIEQAQRFGNAAYRTWFERMTEQSRELCERLLPEDIRGAAVELVGYWCDSFGNRSRIDYGTGHEMNFLIFLLCLNKLGVFEREREDGTTENCNMSLVNLVFAKYMDVVRALQMRYCMEPAGSHGVYSLDDYQFLPFYFGASQLAGSALEPRDIPDRDAMETNKNNYLFCAAIAHIHQVKTGPFSEHSNQLWNISAVPHWKKVNEGLLKMYKAEVLSKFPIVQHILFGTLFKFQSN